MRRRCLITNQSLAQIFLECAGSREKFVRPDKDEDENNKDSVRGQHKINVIPTSKL